MKRKLSALSGRYLVALRKHLKQGSRASSQAARGLGCQAVGLGLETLEVARMHDRALTRLEASSSKDGLIERAEVFFTEAIVPIEQSHRAALRASARLKKLNQLLDRRTVGLAATNRALNRGIARRKTVEAALRQSGEHYTKLWKESLALQKHLQRLTHRILSAQEDKRKRLSHDLQDEIAQTLLGINPTFATGGVERPKLPEN